MNESGDRKAGTTSSPPPAESAGETDVELEDFDDLARTHSNDTEAPKFDPHDRYSEARQSDMTLIMDRARRQTGPRISELPGRVGELPPPQLPPFKLPTTEAPPAVSIADQSDQMPPMPKRFPTPMADQLATTQPGIELGRPVFAVVAIAVIFAAAAFFIKGRPEAIGVGIGGLTATLNLWAFTRIGSAMFEGQRSGGAWGLMAMIKLFVLFGAVFWVLKKDFADPLSFLVGYLSLPVGIVASQLLGLRPDFGNGEGSI
ncbi:MAG: ATP synthase subunit I [Polyangiaceae bacterium]